MSYPCDATIEFAMEAPGFRVAFTCSRRAGHGGEHVYGSSMRQRESGELMSYSMRWWKQGEKGKYPRFVDADAVSS